MIWFKCFLIGPFPASFFFTCIFSMQLIVNKIDDDWIRTADLPVSEENCATTTAQFDPSVWLGKDCFGENGWGKFSLNFVLNTFEKTFFPNDLPPVVFATVKDGSSAVKGLSASVKNASVRVKCFLHSEMQLFDNKKISKIITFLPFVIFTNIHCKKVSATIPN